jgi:3-deoxy-D-manno-octulosonic-acid transferase
VLLYRLLLTLLALKELTSRALRGDWDAIRDRLARRSPPDATPRIWVHAASNGELMSAKPVIQRLVASDRAVLLTVNTDSALAMAQGWGMDGVTPCLAPLDLAGATNRMYRRWTITAHVTFESDIWPRRILACPGPVLVLGARLTERSAKGWRRFNVLARRMVSKIDYLSAQDQASSDRFAALGVRTDAIGPVFDLKALYTPPTVAPDPALKAAFDRGTTWLAASTHEGEEAVVLAAHKAALQHHPELKLILAPRHPKRADAIAAMITEAGLTLARRSAADDPATAQVYLADTLGEMHLWYALAGITFVAGSLTDRGGHTPYEPATFGSAILHGPDTTNFRAAYERLHKASAATQVDGAKALAQALIALESPEEQAHLGQMAQAALRQDTDLDSLMQDVIAVLDA